MLDGGLPERAPGTGSQGDGEKDPRLITTRTAILGKTVLISLCTGGLGGFIYLSTSTEVNGFSVVQMELSEVEGGKVLLKKEYPGFYTEKMAKISCDTPGTRVRMVTQGFKAAMQSLKEDVRRLSTKDAQASQ